MVQKPAWSLSDRSYFVQIASLLSVRIPVWNIEWLLVDRENNPGDADPPECGVVKREEHFYKETNPLLVLVGPMFGVETLFGGIVHTFSIYADTTYQAEEGYTAL